MDVGREGAVSGGGSSWLARVQASHGVGGEARGGQGGEGHREGHDQAVAERGGELLHRLRQVGDLLEDRALAPAAGEDELEVASVTSEGSSARTSFCMLFSDCRLPSTTGTRGRIRNAMLTRLRAHSPSRRGRESPITARPSRPWPHAYSRRR